MNFLDAHKIVHDYGGALGKGADKDALLFRPLSYLPYQDKDKVIDAYKIFYAHMILHGTRTQEQYEQYKVSLMSLNTFIQDDTYYYIIERVKNHKDEIKHYLYFASEFMSNYYRNQEVDDYFDHMIDVKNACHQMCLDGKIDANNYIYQYCVEAYKSARIKFEEEYYYYFFTFEDMRRFITDEEYGKYYTKYKNYLLNYQ